MRPWSAPASLVPVVLAGALANRDLGTDLLTAPFFLCLGGVLALHFAANLTNTYFDYVRKVDTKESADDRALVDSKLAPRVVLGMAIACFAAAAAKRWRAAAWRRRTPISSASRRRSRTARQSVPRLRSGDARTSAAVCRVACSRTGRACTIGRSQCAAT